MTAETACHLNSKTKCESYQGKPLSQTCSFSINLHITPATFDNKSCHFFRLSTHLDAAVGTMTLRNPDKVTLNSVESFLQEILWEEAEGMEIMRLKGLVSLGDTQVIIQGVHDTYDTYRRPTKDEDSQQGCVVVLIGRNLIKDSIMRIFSKHIAT